MDSIDWKKFESNYTKIGDGDKKRIVATNWRPVEKSYTGSAGPVKKPGLALDVLEEDGVACGVPKLLEITNFVFVQKLRPLIEKAEASQSSTISFEVVRVGTGASTKYAVTPV